MPSRQEHKKNVHKTKSKIQEKTKKLNLYKPLAIALLVLVLTIYEYTYNGDTTWFWLGLILSVIIMLPNIFWLATKKGTTFGLPLIFTMLKTKHFVNTIHKVSKHAKIMEKISIVGMFSGFGIAGVDYWIARKQGGLKRILILIISAIVLGIIFWYTMQMLFAVPALAPLLIPGLIGFVLLGFGGLSLVFLLGYGVLSVLAVFAGEQICPSVAPVLPGVPIPGLGVVVPLIAWVSLGLILVIHEGAHGVMLSYYKEKIHSVGLILVGIVPMGAFVEQDDKTFEKRDDKKQLLVLSAGPTSNLFTMLIGIIVFLLFLTAVAPLATNLNNEFSQMYSGIRVSSVEDTVSFCGITKEAPAKGNLFPEDIIISLNGMDVNNVTFLSSEIAKSDELNFRVLRNGVEENVFIKPVLFESMGIKRIGVVFEQIPTGYQPPILTQILASLISGISSIIFFFIILSFAVGMFNFLPSDPLDGGRMAKIILLPYFGFLKFNKKETELFIGRLFVWLFLISILVNLLPYVTMVI